MEKPEEFGTLLDITFRIVKADSLNEFPAVYINIK